MCCRERVVTYSNAHACTVPGSGSAASEMPRPPRSLESPATPQNITRVVQPNSSDSSPLEALTRSQVEPHSRTWL